MSKHLPASREEFKQLVLRKCGAPVIQINVSDDQVEDCIEEALKYFTDYHYDGTEHVYYVVSVTQDDIDHRYVDVPAALIGVTDIYTASQQLYSISAASMFNGGYQMVLDFAFSASSGSVLSYYMNKTNYEFLSQMLVGQSPIRFNRHLNRVHIDINWDRIPVGENIIFDGYMKLDPNTTTDLWADRWLAKYCAAKVKYIWGTNLSKWEGMQLPNGGTLNGSKIQDDAHEEIQSLEDEMISNYSIPPRDVIA